MKKSLVASLFVVLAVLAMAVPASAQLRYSYIPQTPEGWFYAVQGNQVAMLTADNLGMVHNMTNQLRREDFRNLRDDLRWNSGYSAYGVPVDGGRFYPMYDQNRQPMSRKVATATGAVLGAGIGYGATGNVRGTVIGAAAGAIIGLVTHRGNGNNNRDDMPPPPPQFQQGVRIASDGTPVAVGYRPYQEPISKPPTTAGEWKVSNRTSKRAELWDGERFIARIEPWQSAQVAAPTSGYKAVFLIPNRSGGLTQETGDIRSSSNFNGWDIVAPAVQ